MYILDDHDEEREFNAEGLALVLWAGDEGSGYVGAHDLQDGRLDVLIGESLDVSVVNWIKVRVLCLSQICSGLLPME